MRSTNLRRFRKMTKENQVMVIAGVVFILVGGISCWFLYFPTDPPVASSRNYAQTGWNEPLRPDELSSVPWLVFVLFAIALVVMLAAAGWAIFGVFRRDAPTFEERPEAEQERLHEAGDVLHLGLKGAPPVANSVATKEGRRAGREVTRRSKAARREH